MGMVLKILFPSLIFVNVFVHTLQSTDDRFQNIRRIAQGISISFKLKYVSFQCTATLI